jgi:hypothetical protein
VSEQILFVASPDGLQRLNKVYTHLIAVIESCSDEEKTYRKILQGRGPVTAVPLTVPSRQDFSGPLDGPF